MRRTCPMLVLVLLAGAGAAAQDRPSPASTGEASAHDLLPGAAERLARMLEFSYGIVDVSDFKFDQTNNLFNPNPDDTLWKATVKFRGASLFLSPSDLSTAWAKLADYRANFNFAGFERDPLASVNGSTLLNYFERDRPRDWLGRFVSSFTVAGSLGRRARLDFGSSGPPPDANDETKWTYDITFDPTLMFGPGAQRKAAYDAARNYLLAYPARTTHVEVPDPCSGVTGRRCVNRLAGLTGWPAFWATLLPVAKLESIDEFDYATYGGQPILFPEANREGALQNLMLTWDLQRLFRGVESRGNAVDAAKARALLVATRDQLQTPLAILDPVGATLSHGRFVVVRLAAAPDDKALKWSRNPEATSWPEQMIVTVDGYLVGVPTCGGEPPCQTRVNLKVADGHGRSTTRVLDLSVAR